MNGNPYHEPETAGAIWNVAINARLPALTIDALYSLLPKGGKPGWWPDPPPLRRSLEIVLSRVKMNPDMRRDLMAALDAARRAELSGQERAE